MEELLHGQNPSAEALAFGLNSKESPPPEMQAYLARKVAEGDKPSRGRPPTPWLQRKVLGDYVRAAYAMMEERGQAEIHEKGQTPLIRTHEELARNGVHISIETVRDIVWKRNGWG